MPKQPLSVTLERDNLLWLRGLTARGKRKSLSDALDALVTAARLAGTQHGPSRSVAGTVDIPPDDPDLAGADAYIRSLFAASLSKPLVARERSPKYGRTKRARTRG
jgi:hypothetical protein